CCLARHRLGSDVIELVTPTDFRPTRPRDLRSVPGRGRPTLPEHTLICCDPFLCCVVTPFVLTRYQSTIDWTAWNEPGSLREEEGNNGKRGIKTPPTSPLPAKRTRGIPRPTPTLPPENDASPAPTPPTKKKL